MGPTVTDLATSALLNDGLRWLDADTAFGRSKEGADQLMHGSWAVASGSIRSRQARPAAATCAFQHTYS